MLLVAILETSCLGCLDPLHPPSVAVPLIVGLCLTLEGEQGISEFTRNLGFDAISIFQQNIFKVDFFPSQLVSYLLVYAITQ